MKIKKFNEYYQADIDSSPPKQASSVGDVFNPFLEEVNHLCADLIEEYDFSISIKALSDKVCRLMIIKPSFISNPEQNVIYGTINGIINLWNKSSERDWYLELGLCGFLNNIPSAIRKCMNLKGLYLNDNNIRKIENLEGLENLELLSFINCKIDSMNGLGKLVSLKSLNLKGNNISDFSEISKLINLKFINVNGNKTNDKAALKQLNKNIAIIKV